MGDSRWGLILSGAASGGGALGAGVRTGAAGDWCREPAGVGGRRHTGGNPWGHGPNIYKDTKA
jgi:hypothetical protein